GVSDIRIARREGEFADDAAFWVLLGVEKEKPPIRLELWMTGEAKQTLFVLDERLPIHDIDELLRAIAVAPFLDDHDATLLFHNEETPRSVRRLFHPQRTIHSQLRQDKLQFNFRKGLGGKPQAKRSCEHK